MGTEFSDNQVAKHVEVRDLYLTKVDVKNSTITYVGKAIAQDTATSAKKWQIARLSLAGKILTTEYADSAKFSQIFDDRDALFTPVGFVNVFSLFYDGANDFSDVTHDIGIDFDLQTEAATWAFWMRTSDTNNSCTYMEKQGGSNPGWRINLDANRLAVEFKGAGGGPDTIKVRTASTFGAAVNDGDWHQIAVTYDGGGIAAGVTIYLDGIAQGGITTVNDGLVTSTSNVVNAAIAGRTGGSDNFGPGHIDEPAIWDVELSAANITTIYNSGVPIDLQDQDMSPITASLMETWRQGDGPSDVFPAIVGVENLIVATMTNMTMGDIQSVVPS